MWRSEIARSAIAGNYRRYVWFVAWPLILLAVFCSCVRGSAPGGEAGQTVQREVTAYGATAILAFITAAPSDVDELNGIFGDLVKPPTGQHGIPLPRRTVLASFPSAKQLGGKNNSDVWQVQLSTVTPDGPETWQIAVRVYPSGDRALSLPGVIPPLPSGPAVAVNAADTIDVTANSGVAVTLRDFFNAWLCGQGDVSRLADTSTVPTFSAPPYSRAQLIGAYAGTQVPQQPGGSITVGVIVWGTKTWTDQLSYTLTLTATAGRWVVTDVSARPLVREVNNNNPAGTAGQ